MQGCLWLCSGHVHKVLRQGTRRMLGITPQQGRRENHNRKSTRKFVRGCYTIYVPTSSLYTIVQGSTQNKHTHFLFERARQGGCKKEQRKKVVKEVSFSRLVLQKSQRYDFWGWGFLDEWLKFLFFTWFLCIAGGVVVRIYDPVSYTHLTLPTIYSV